MLLHNGYDVEVLAHKLDASSSKFEDYYLQTIPSFELTYVDSSRYNPLMWFLYSLVRYICLFFVELGVKTTMILAITEDKLTVPLLWSAYRLKTRFDVILCHNLSAQYVGSWLSERTGRPMVVDIEDFYPGEQDKALKSSIIRAREKILRHCLNHAAYCTFSSAPIESACEELSGQKLSGMVVPNTFPSSEFDQGQYEKEPLKLVWFSQHIDYGRGIDKFLDAIEQSELDVELHLIGNLRPSFASLISDRHFVHVHDVMDQDSLHKFLASFHIGLALEDANTDTNRDLCLTNKIWAYYLAGHYIIYSDTKAQKDFMESRPTHGIKTNVNDLEDIKSCLRKVYEDRNSIIRNHKIRYKQSRAFAWESISKSWLPNIEKVIRHE